MNQNATPPEHDPEAIRRGRLKAGALFAIAFTPILLATLMFYTGWGIPASTTNKGELLEGNPQVTETALLGSEGEGLAARFLPENQDAKWWILVVADQCQEACQEWLYMTRQVHILLNRDADRVQRAFYAANPDVLDRDTHPLIEIFQSEEGRAVTLPNGQAPSDGPFVFIVDPMGNMVLRYDDRHTADDVLDDIEHLLDTSPLG